MSETVLQAEHLKKVFNKGKKAVTAVEDVSFSLEQGECLAIVGESGSGKSTIARIVTRLLKDEEGRVSLLGEDITNVKGRDLRKVYREIQMVFQMPMESFDPRRTLGDGIGESLRNMGLRKKETRKKVEELLITCGLTPEFADRYPHEVSGGQCQRAAIARALAVDPALLICDEATSALDVTVQMQIVQLLRNLQKERGLSLLMITHDLALAQALSDRILVMYHGRIIEEGTPDEIIGNPKEEYTKKLIDSVI